MTEFLNSDFLSSELGMLVAMFVGVSGVMLILFLIVARRRKRMQERLQVVAGDDSGEGPASTLVLGDLTPAMAAQMPISEGDRGEIQRELRQAGYYRPTAVMEYAALRAVFVIVPLIAAGVLAVLTDTAMMAVYIWIGGVIVALLGFSLPRIYVYYRGQSRMDAIERGMPTAIDMLTMCLSAGLNVLNSLDRVVRELASSFPILAYELAIVRRQAELRSLEFALAQFAERVGLAHARNLAVILTQSENLGTDAVVTLREYADNMRINMRMRADEVANKAPFKLLFPAYMMAIGAAILIISPTVLEFSAFRKNNIIQGDMSRAREILRTGRLIPRPPADQQP